MATADVELAIISTRVKRQGKMKKSVINKENSG